MYCGEEGGERAAAPLLQVLSNFALSLENGVKKYDQRVERERKLLQSAKKKKGTEKEKGKENRQNAPTSSQKLLRASSLQPHVGVTGKVKRPITQNPMNALFNAIKEKGSNKSDTSHIPTQRADPKQALLAAIKDKGSKKSDKSHIPTQKADPKQALLASIKNRRKSLPSNSPPDGVPDRVKHINNTMGRKESRVLLVNRMLSEAPASVKQG